MHSSLNSKDCLARLGVLISFSVRSYLIAQLTCLACATLSNNGSAEEVSSWTFLENEEIKLGVKRSSGGAIGWFSLSKSSQNLINHFDKGRLIQQSYYGRRDGSQWAQQDWRWNPVQGGDFLGHAAQILKFSQSKDSLYVATRPKHWANGNDIDDVLMEQWINLLGPVAHIRYRMTYTGTESHPRHDQEIPAVFVDRSLESFVIGQIGSLKKYSPGFPNERYPFPEHWAAYVDSEEFGLGVCVPQANELTCYRVGQIGQAGACSYFAPLAIFAITPDTVFEYDCYLTIGKLHDIQSRFQKLTTSALPDESSTLPPP